MNEDERSEFAKQCILFITNKCENISESIQVMALIEYIWWLETIRNYADFKKVQDVEEK